MKNYKRFMISILFIILCLVVVPNAEAAFSGSGAGTVEDPYLITTPAQLNEVRNDLTKYYKLTNDIDLSGHSSWTSIGANANDSYYWGVFTGSFDGSNHSILNLKGNPLFYSLKGGTVKNLTINGNITATPQTSIGMLASKITNTSTIVENVHVTGDMLITGSYNIGGIIGESAGTIRNCSSAVTITTSSTASCGGVSGLNLGTIEDSYATGDINLTGSSGFGFAGGLVGSNGTVNRCYATGNIQGKAFIGGLVGSGGAITDSFALGNVTGVSTSTAGGLVGSPTIVTNSYAAGKVSIGNLSGGLTTVNPTYASDILKNLLNNYWVSETSGVYSESALGKMEAKHIAQMKQQTTFSGWDFASVWQIDEGVNYPYLKNCPKPIFVTPTEHINGLGTADDPYLISTPDQLDKVRNCLTANYKLVNDIDMSGITWTSIGPYMKYYTGAVMGGTPPIGFSGIFDGNNHIIKNLTGQPLISYTKDSTIKNLTMENANITSAAGNAAGIVAGWVTGTDLIENVHTSGSLSFTLAQLNIGGIIGSKYGTGAIKNSSSSATITSSSSSNAGGLAGEVSGGLVENCYATGSINGSASNAGGLVGKSNTLTTISSCYSTGNVQGVYTGGLVGNSGKITNCFALGNVTGTSVAGGLSRQGAILTNCYSVGKVTAPTAGGLIAGTPSTAPVYCYWDIPSSGQTTSQGGEGKSYEEMKQQATFQNWDFNNVWNVVEGATYPWLRMLPIPDMPDFSYTTVTGVSLDKTTLELDVKETAALIPTISPTDATIKAVSWKSANESIATVESSGLIKGMSAGTTIITATTIDGNHTATCNVNVKSSFNSVIILDSPITGTAYSKLSIDSNKKSIVVSGTVQESNNKNVKILAKLINTSDVEVKQASTTCNACATAQNFELVIAIDNILEGIYKVKVTTEEII